MMSKRTLDHIDSAIKNTLTSSQQTQVVDHRWARSNSWRTYHYGMFGPDSVDTQEYSPKPKQLSFHCAFVSDVACKGLGSNN